MQQPVPTIPASSVRRSGPHSTIPDWPWRHSIAPSGAADSVRRNRRMSIGAGLGPPIGVQRGPL